ncbi:protein Jumonji isoform X2 [Copidosoma floridanum]|uniref:protein Jumonji isoform X2 n=1 Tax=Copidosoma floridanum TaxID=29053 RepID=UPI0006C97D0B|nr:protein Jumonji isoform X2 [Copidosoma floridanum]
MVLNRNDKRKRKEGDLVDLVDPLAELPKRNKIHAQRKFAQGAATPAYSPASTPLKEKDKSKAAVFHELIPHKRPKADDFLTFLCFRGTSILPPSLNFFDANPRKEKAQDAAKLNGISTAHSKANGTCGKSTASSKASHSVSAQKQTKEKMVIVTKKQVPAAAPQLKSTSTAIQALKKKYQEQRLAKQRLKKYKPSVMKTRSNATVTADPIPVKPTVSPKVAVNKKVPSRIESTRRGLRSTGLPESEQQSLPLKTVKKDLPAKLKKKIAPKDDASSVDSFSVKTSTKKTPSAKVIATSKSLQNKLASKKKKDLEDRRVTRSKANTPPVTRPPTPTTNVVMRRPTRKTKEAATLYMEILGRKLVSPDLENDDNMSVESFPELPNARKLAQTENEIKAKVKKASLNQSGAAAGIKEKKATSSASSNTASPTTTVTAATSKPLKKKLTTKPAVAQLKNKRPVKVQKYCELNSDDESISSKETSEEAKPTPTVTRRSAPSSVPKDTKKSENRSLRSSRSLTARTAKEKISPTQPAPAPQQSEPSAHQLPAAKSPDSQGVAKSIDREQGDQESKTGVKRRREPAPSEKEKDGPKVSKNKSKPAVEAQEESEEEESLGALLDKLKRKKREAEKEENNTVEASVKKPAEPKTAKTTTTTTVSTTITTSTATTVLTLDAPVTKTVVVEKSAAPTKISDDEESLFRGFAKKAISKIKPNVEDIDSKANVLAASGLKDVKSSAITCVKPLQEQLMGSGTTNSTAANASVKLEPDFGELKFDKTSKMSPAAMALNIIDIPKDLNHHGRKERVNMSTEQIEKWLNESSLAKEESKVEMESVSSFKFDLMPAPPAAKPERKEPPVSHLSISPKIQHLVRPVNVTLSKLTDRLKRAATAPLGKVPSAFFSSNQVTSVRPQLPIAVAKTVVPKPTTQLDIAKDKKEQTLPSSPPSRKMSKDSSLGDDAAESDVVSKSDANSTADSSEKKSSISPEKKVFFHQRKPFLPKFKERKQPSSSSAFSPENESSVYAFESEAEAPVSTPFRRKARNQSATKDSPDIAEKDKEPSTQTTAATATTSSSSEAKQGKSSCSSVEDTTKKATEPLNSPEEARRDEEKSPPLLERTTTPKNFELPKNFADLTNIQVLPLDKLTTSWSAVSCSASIAVQVNLDDATKQQQQQRTTTAESHAGESSASQRSTEISTQTDGANNAAADTNNDDDDDDNSGQLFYIPLQAVTRNASAQGGQQLIQGVAVKLGTEGPTGPNQRVLLKAKLVTKPPISVARCPPIGTVQPTARAPQTATSDQADLPSTSAVETEDADLKFQTPNSDRGNKTATLGSKQSIKSSEKAIKLPKARERKASIDECKTGSKKSHAKTKNLEVSLPVNDTTFPKTKDANEPARLVEAPVFHPSAKEFKDPLEYIDKIRPIAEKFGICKVVPPSYFKPECKVSDDMRFTAYNQYVHRMLNRWGPNVKEMMAMKRYLITQSISLTQPPFIGGMEIDLPYLYQTVQTLGGLKEVIEKKKWQKVADAMKIPKSAQDRVTKLDDIYCKYLLPYDMLSQDERNKVFKDVEAAWQKRERRDRQETQSNDTEDEDDEESLEEFEECIVKGRNMPLNAFYRIARNTQRMWFGDNGKDQVTCETEGASATEVESAFWKHVVEKKRHVCVHAASIDSSGHGFGFSVMKNSPFARHPWNLKVLTNNAGSVLRALGPQMGVTVPTLHVGMLFSACCWYRDPHGLPWIEYLHTGAKKIWYGIPDEQNNAFRKALTKMFPRYCKNKTIWLPSDTAMVPPDMLVSNDVPLCQTVQEPGQFIVVFPKAFTSSVCTGYVVSESVYFAQPSWLETAEQVFQDIHNSCEPTIFSFERLLFSVINDLKSHIDVLKQILPTVIKICNKEIENRKKLRELGLMNNERVPLPSNDKKGKGKKTKKEEIDYECDTCRANLFVSLLSNPLDGSILCLTHAIQYIENKKQVIKNCTLMYTYSESELNGLVDKLKDRIEAKTKKTNQIKAK